MADGSSERIVGMETGHGDGNGTSKDGWSSNEEAKWNEESGSVERDTWAPAGR